MYILAFETSCDDTSIALLKDNKLIAMKTHSQIKEHLKNWWVVPELAARLHSNVIFTVLDEVLKDANLDLDNINYIACTKEPGLIPSLLVWQTVAKTISKLKAIPLIWINHIEAHMFANFLERKKSDIKFPNICLTVSGWHNEIYLWKSIFEFELIWQTLDDAAWEAFDKVSRMLWLWFPWGAFVVKKAERYEWNYDRIFPCVMLDKDSLDFSFSGLKSAVNRYVIKLKKENLKFWKTKEEKLLESDIIKIAYEFEEVVSDILLKKMDRAVNKLWIKNIMLAWWVSANTKLKDKLTNLALKDNLDFKAPIKNIYSMDNAAMIWINAFYKIKNNIF